MCWHGVLHATRNSVGKRLVLVLVFVFTACSSTSSGSSSSPKVTAITTTTVVGSSTSSSLSPNDSPAMVNGVYAEPRPELTPGAADARVTQANVDSTICVSGYTLTVRPPTSYTEPVKRERLAAYGYAYTPANFELDHLVPLELGGDPRAVANLWPEPWEAKGARLVRRGWGAETKDQLEDYLHRAVCAHRMLLVEAQRQMAEHWITAAQRVGIAAGSQ